MWKIERKLYNRIKSHYDNRGGEGDNSGHFELMPLTIQNEITLLTGIDINKEFVLFASYLKDEYLVVITDQNLYWLSSENTIKHTALEKLKSVNYKIYESHKSQLGCLELRTNEGEQFMIKMEEGKTRSSINNVLLLIIRLRK